MPLGALSPAPLPSSLNPKNVVSHPREVSISVRARWEAGTEHKGRGSRPVDRERGALWVTYALFGTQPREVSI